MAILYDPSRRTLTLTTRRTAYQMQVGPLGHLLHLYYGRRAEDAFDYLYIPQDRGFSPNPYELRDGRGWSLDALPQEYSGSCRGDYRLPALELTSANGRRGAELRYAGHEIRDGKYALEGLPCAFAAQGQAQTLTVTLRDETAQVEAELFYGVYEAEDIITRAVRVRNTGTEDVRLDKAASLCLDIPFGAWELMEFHGRHTMERLPGRAPLPSGVRTVSSRRGMTSHQHDPFVILCRSGATEEQGECYGVMLAYSGSHRTDVELDQNGSVRVVSGVNHEMFSWQLAPGESFDTPEVILSFTHEGLTALSHNYHRFLRQNVCRGRWARSRRPVLLNSWEAAYFDFDADAILRLARGAKELGAELLVLDDGWFGERNDDRRALGDWYPNEKKLSGGLDRLIDGVNALGLGFGLWLEPEMVSEDSELYRAHPDWALTAPGRTPVMGRDQLVLDLSRPEVADWVYETVAGLLGRYRIEYVKWDMNRGLADIYSRALPAERQGEVSHRYMLGLYGVLERLTRAFPDVLFEGCAGGGGRFDAGMLAYCPQIWGSDNTDPVARLHIQYGASFGYPISAVAAHISASPNHQTGRSTPLGTRAAAAMTGAFGLELDPERLSAEERDEVRALAERWREHETLIRTGDCYRLAPPDGYFAAWESAAEDGSEALVTVIITRTEGNPPPVHIRPKGLVPEARYELRRTVFGCARPVPETGRAVFSGAALMYGGYALPPMAGDWPGAQLYLRRVNDQQ